MSIAKGDFLIDQVYKSGTGANKMYKGTDLIYDRSLKNKFEYFYVYAAEPLRDDEAAIAGTISLTNNGGNAPDVEYSRDGVNWTTWDYSALNLYGPVSSDESSPIYSFIFFRGNNPNGFSSSRSVYSMFNIHDNLSGGAYITIGGNIMSLLYKDSFWKEDISPNNTIPNNYCFYRLFYQSDIYSCLGGPGIYNHSSIGAFRLPAKNLKTWCYCAMFQYCSKLVKAPVILPATTMFDYCYQYMFGECSSLVYPPKLCGKTMSASCYQSMFQRCSNLVTAPDIIVTSISHYCFSQMFLQCTSLNYIKYIGVNNTSGYIGPWASWCTSVSSTGTFVKNTGVTLPSGASGIPEGWTVEEV